MQNQRQKMMKYHDNHDAFCSKNLLKWQHFVLKKFCEQMFRVVKESAHMKFSKNLRTQLMNVQIDVEIVLISSVAVGLGSDTFFQPDPTRRTRPKTQS
jgi:hypothetical protein